MFDNILIDIFLALLSFLATSSKIANADIEMVILGNHSALRASVRMNEKKHIFVVSGLKKLP